MRRLDGKLLKDRHAGTKERGHEGEESDEASESTSTFTSCLRASVPLCLPPNSRLLSVVIIRTIANRQIVLAVSVAAAQRGIKPGMTLAQARALHAQVKHVEHEPHRDSMALEALARWMMRFSPCVSLIQQEQAQPEGIWLDLTGTERLFGPAERIHQTIEASLRRWSVTARLAIAPTPGAAWAMTFYQAKDRHGGAKARRHAGEVGDAGSEKVSAFTSCLRASLPPCLPTLPIHSLRLPADTVAALHHVGIHTISQLRKLPRNQLSARFGSMLLMRLNQFDGLIEEPLMPLEPTFPITARRRWEEPVENLDLIWPITRELIDDLATKLLRRGHGAREMEATLRLALGEPIRRTIRFSRPTRDPKRIFELLQQSLGNVEARRHGGTEARRQAGSCILLAETTGGSASKSSLRASVPACLRTFPSVPSDLSAFDYNGFISIDFNIGHSQRMVTEQIELGQSDTIEARRELDDLIERLRVRMDQSAVIQVTPVESHLPEKGVEYCARDEGSEDRHGGTKARRHEVKAGTTSLSSPSCLPTRPLWLRHPTELRVIVSPSHDRDGRPVSVTDPDGAVHRVVYAVGPERICGEWWNGHNKSRDYFDIELPNTRRWWIFRVNESGRWFWQGEF